MRINGMREFLSRFITPLNSAGLRGNDNPLALVVSQQKNGSGILNLSDIGKRLSINTNKAPLLDGSQKAGVSVPILSATGKYLSRAETILDKMHKLAVIARDDEKLSDLDRIDLQIETEKLRKELKIIEFDYKAKVEGSMSYAEIRRKFDFSDIFSENEVGMPYAWEKGDDTTLLGRARDRIMRGEKWNVKEAFVPRDIYDKEPGDFIESAMGEFITSENVSSYYERKPSIEGGRWAVIDDEDIVNASLIPTVREQLERGNSIMLMDAESAAEGAGRLEGDIEAVRKLRVQYTEAVSSYQKSEASGEIMDTQGIAEIAQAVFKRIAYGRGATILSMMSPSPVDPAGPEFFYFGGNDLLGLPDRIVDARNINKTVSPEDYAKGLGGRTEPLKPVDASKWPMDIYMNTETYKQSPPTDIKLDTVA